MKKFSILFLAFIAVKTYAQQSDDTRVPNQFIVMMKPEVPLEKLLEEIASLKIKECLSGRMNIWLLENVSSSSDGDLLLELRNSKYVKLAQFNHAIESRSLTPNDIHFSEQWNMLNTGQSGGTAGADIDATEAWELSNDNVTACGDTVVIAIIDDKVNLLNAELNFFRNYNEVDSNGIDDDGNGYIDDTYGWNAFQNNGSVAGSDNHTMHTAGIAAAKGNNNMGVAGVCWGAKILPVVYGMAVQSNVVKAYDYVRNMRLLYNSTFGIQGAFVVSTNTSFGIDMMHPSTNPIWCAMYDSMGAVGILSAAATTNSFVDVDLVGDIPTECTSEWLITVTNTSNTDARHPAGWGEISIDLGAPGKNVISTFSQGYGYLTGTSMSSPHVAGAIAAMYSAGCKGLCEAYVERPDSISLLIKKYLLEGAEWISSMNNITVTNGRLNLHRAIVNLQQFDCDSCGFDIDIDKIPVSCKGSNDGAMAVVIDSGSIFDYNILWSNNVTAPEILSLQPGFYTVAVRDSNNCRRFMTAEVHNPDTILINTFNVIAATDSTSGNITVNASAGNEPLEYSKDGINYQQTQIFSVSTNGTYTVYIRNTTGCVVQQQVLVSGIDEFLASDFSFQIFPNPADEELRVYCSLFTLKEVSLQVFDLQGRKIYETIPATANCQLSTAKWNAGIYFLRCGNTTKKFVVMH